MRYHTTQQINTLLYYLKTRQQPPFAILFYKNLIKINFDYTKNSIVHLNHFFQILASKNYTQQQLLAQTGGSNFFLALAGYLGDYLAITTGHDIIWLDYQESLEEFEQQNQQSFNNTITARIGETFFFQPLQIIWENLQGRQSLETCIEQCQQQIFASSTINVFSDPNDVCQTYLEKVKTGKLLDTTIGFFEQLQHLTFDYSEKSLYEIDTILTKIKQKYQLTPQHYDRIIRQATYQSFCYLLGFYIGITSAKLANTAVKWASYEQMQPLLDDPNFVRCIEYSFVLLMENNYRTPILVITNHLFDITAEYTKSVVEFAQIMQTENQSVFHIFPKKITTKTTALPKTWQLAMQGAGELLAKQVLNLANDGEVKPCLFEAKPTTLPDNIGQISLISLADADRAIDNLYQQLASNPKNLPFLIGCFDMYANLPVGRFDGVVVEIRVYEPKLMLQLILPYRSAMDSRGFAIYPLVSNQQQLPNEIDELIDKLYRFLVNYSPSLNQQNFWKNYYVDSFDRWALTPIQQLENKTLVKNITLSILPEDSVQIINHSEPVIQKDFTSDTTFSQPVLTPPEFDYSSISWQTFSLATTIYRLPTHYRSYLQVTMPNGLATDELFSQVEAMATLYRKGHVVWGVIIQAKAKLFQPLTISHEPQDYRDNIGDVLYDVTGRATVAELQEIAEQLSHLKNSDYQSLPIDQQLYANHLQDNHSRLFGLACPKSLTEKNFRISSLWVWRQHLPCGLLADKVLPIVVCHDNQKFAGQGRVMILPAYFWQRPLYQYWLDTIRIKFNIFNDFYQIDEVVNAQANSMQEYRTFPKLKQLFATETTQTSNIQNVNDKPQNTLPDVHVTSLVPELVSSKQISVFNRDELQEKLLQDHQRLTQQFSTSNKSQQKKWFVIGGLSLMVLLVASLLVLLMRQG